ncbi:MAG: glycosyltransferase family 2 protein, partial [Actinomycetota bacterium]
GTSDLDLATLYPGVPHDEALMVDEAIHGLRRRNPLGSASVTFTRGQKYVTIGLGLSVLLCGALWPKSTVTWGIGIFTFIYLVTLFDRVRLFSAGLSSREMLMISDEEALALTDEELPIYTVLLPAYGEPDVIAQLLAGVGKLNYPREKLQLLLLLEADDDSTVDSAYASNDSSLFEIVLVPAAEPRTKPKACNYGLLRATGSIVTIYDAEDIPDPLQLRRVVASFNRLPQEVVCIQAKLVFYNDTQNYLTRWFTSEYDQWFGYILPGLMAVKSPIPLGGTSNHIKTEVLVEAGGWDPFNVTEDCDLGFRLAKQGYETAVLDSATYEEANSDPINWIRQRSRWYKGYMQTFLVNFRSPVATFNDFGFKRTLRLITLSIGLPLLTATNMVFWLLTLTWILGQPDVMRKFFPPLTYFGALISLVLGNAAIMYMGLIVAREDRKHHLLVAAFTTPIYWVLMSVAAIKAIVQLLFQPSYWEKTHHGLHDDEGAVDIVHEVKR